MQILKIETGLLFNDPAIIMVVCLLGVQLKLAVLGCKNQNVIKRSYNFVSNRVNGCRRINVSRAIAFNYLRMTDKLWYQFGTQGELSA